MPYPPIPLLPVTMQHALKLKGTPPSWPTSHQTNGQLSLHLLPLQTTPLLQEYASHELPVKVRLECSLHSIRKAIAKGHHTSTLTATSTDFCQTDILKCSLRCFIIILNMEDTIRLFGTLLRISHLASVEHHTHKLRLICNSRKSTSTVNLVINSSSDKSSASKAMQFGPCLSQLLHRVWEADPKEVPIWLSKLDISYAFHWCKLRPSDVGKFSYVIPLSL